MYVGFECWNWVCCWVNGCVYGLIVEVIVVDFVFWCFCSDLVCFRFLIVGYILVYFGCFMIVRMLSWFRFFFKRNLWLFIYSSMGCFKILLLYMLFFVLKLWVIKIMVCYWNCCRVVVDCVCEFNGNIYERMCLGG